MDIHSIAPGDQRAVHDFIDLPFSIYRDDPLWVPPMRSEIELLFDRDRHPFYATSEALFLVARCGRRPVGRLVVADNHEYNEYTHRADAFFGYLEFHDDPAILAALFEQGVDWARRRGLRRLIGARGLLRGDGLGVLVDGFEHFPALGIPYNPSYYAEHLEGLGFEKLYDYYSGNISSGYRLPERLHRIAEHVKLRRGYRVRQFASKHELRRAIPLIREVYNTAFAESPDFYPMGEREVAILAERLFRVARPELIKLVYRQDELVGFLLAYPNIGAGIRRARGRLWPLGWLHLLWELHTTRRLDINGLGVLPGHRGAGANAVMYTEMEATLRGSRFTQADTVQVRDENVKSMGDMTALGVRWYKRHRIYQIEL